MGSIHGLLIGFPKANGKCPVLTSLEYSFSNEFDTDEWRHERAAVWGGFLWD